MSNFLLLLPVVSALLFHFPDSSMFFCFLFYSELSLNFEAWFPLLLPLHILHQLFLVRSSYLLRSLPWFCWHSVLFFSLSFAFISLSLSSVSSFVVVSTLHVCLEQLSQVFIFLPYFCFLMKCLLIFFHYTMIFPSRSIVIFLYFPIIDAIWHFYQPFCYLFSISN